MGDGERREGGRCPLRPIQGQKRATHTKKAVAFRTGRRREGVGSMRLAITKGQTKKGGGEKTVHVQKRGRKTALHAGLRRGGGENGMRNIKKLLFLLVKCDGGHT